MAVSAAHHAIRRRRNAPFSLPCARPAIPPPEAQHWWWHPNRVQVQGPPEWFAEELRAFDPDLAVTWNAYSERWLVWMRSPKFQHPLCQGWKLLFVVRQSDDHSYAPLDARIFARLYSASAARWGQGRYYWQRIEAEMERDRQRVEQNRANGVGDVASEFYDFTKIKNYGKGNKFQTYHSGEVSRPDVARSA